jgi:hypothetical protein
LFHDRRRLFSTRRFPLIRNPKAMLSKMLLGEGLGFWKTIPILRRISTASISGA